jgi:hypothetical protein
MKSKKCLEFLLLDSSNYESWCISILHNIKAFNPSLLSIVKIQESVPQILIGMISPRRKENALN